jgi:hypothetical protein
VKRVDEKGGRGGQQWNSAGLPVGTELQKAQAGGS